VGDNRYLDRADWAINVIHAWQDGNLGALGQLNPQMREPWKEEFRNGYGPQSSMYGAVWQGLKQYCELRGRKDVLKYMQRAAEWIYPKIEAEVSDTGQNSRHHPLALALPAGLALLYEYTATPKYWDLAMRIFSQEVGVEDDDSCVGVFGLRFGHSQHFLWYLSKEFVGPQKRELSLNSQ